VKKFPKISIITPCYNQVNYIEECILSVINQDYPDIEYIIIDGGSNDGTIDIIKKYENKISYWISEKDDGFPHALQKGFSRATGEIMAWINGDDKYHPCAFKAIAEIFSSFPNVNWILGYPMFYSDQGWAVTQVSLEWTRWSKYRFFNGDFLAIQQESTFWKRNLWEKAGGYIDSNLLIAVDFDLWCRFFRHDNIYTSIVLIGGFRFSSNQQLSIKSKTEYIYECKKIISREKNMMSFGEKLEVFIRGIFGIPLTPFFQANIPIFRWLYVKIMKIPDVIYYDFKEQIFKKRWRRIPTKI
jgi:glycosyltransferase involved in cell wall biosynthesis